MTTHELFLPPHFGQFQERSRWRLVTDMAAQLSTLGSAEFQARGGDPMDPGLLAYVHWQTGEPRIPAVQLEEDGVTVQPQVIEMMDLMHRRGLNVIQIAVWWFEPKERFAGMSPAAYLDANNARNRLLTSMLQSQGPNYWLVSK